MEQIGFKQIWVPPRWDGTHIENHVCMSPGAVTHHNSVSQQGTIIVIHIQNQARPVNLFSDGKINTLLTIASNLEKEEIWQNKSSDDLTAEDQEGEMSKSKVLSSGWMENTLRDGNNLRGKGQFSMLYKKCRAQQFHLKKKKKPWNFTSRTWNGKEQRTKVKTLYNPESKPPVKTGIREKFRKGWLLWMV